MKSITSHRAGTAAYVQSPSGHVYRRATLSRQCVYSELPLGNVGSVPSLYARSPGLESPAWMVSRVTGRQN